eukprot:14190205-Heterocapsa_arctica.AAC.1
MRKRGQPHRRRRLRQIYISKAWKLEIMKTPLDYIDKGTEGTDPVENTQADSKSSRKQQKDERHDT